MSSTKEESKETDYMEVNDLIACCFCGEYVYKYEANSSEDGESCDDCFDEIKNKDSKK